MKTLAFLTISFLLFYNCSSDVDFKTEGTYTIENKDGVRYILNLAPAWGNESKVALEFVQKIGGLDAEDENYQFYKLREVVRDNIGNIYVLDAGNYRIQKFDPDGKYLETIGRQGYGPGEFLRPYWIKMDSEDTLYVGDSSSGRHIIVLSLNGKEIRRIKISFVMGDFLLLKSGNFIMFSDPNKKLRSEDMIKETRLVSVLDEYGNIVNEFGILHDYGDHQFNYRGNKFEMALDIYDNVYLTFNSQNRIEKYTSGGELLFRAERPLNYELSHKMGKTEMERKGVIIGYMDYAEFTDVSKRIGIDHNNRIWVQTYKKKKEEDDKPVDYLEFEIFDENGILLGKIPVPESGSMQIIDDRVYFLDSEEEMCVYEYKIIEK